MIYDLIAPLYDKVNGYINYEKWADFIEKSLARYSGVKPVLGLDLGCGTGRMTLELAKRGYDMTGVDYSQDMLSVAHREASALGIADNILWLCQDMTEFELYGTVDFAVSCLDTVNHLTAPSELRECFGLFHNYLVPDGLFIFDVNCRKKFEEVYGENTYTLEVGDDLLIWRNYYNPKTRLCDFLITMFKESSGAYERFDEVQTERMYTLRSVKRELLAAGFEFIGAYSDFDFSDATDEVHRVYIIAKCKK